LARDGGFQVLTKKVIQPGDAEIAANPRARSAKMRVIEKVATAENRFGGERSAPQVRS
jgi:16S rRNA (cytosine1402-N4)-methyltransferase